MNEDTNNLPLAIALLTQTLVTDSNCVQARMKRAQTLIAMGMTAQAQEDMQWLNEHAPDRAISLYTQALKDFPQQVIFYYERGHIYYKMGNYEAAQNDLKCLLELNPMLAEKLTGTFSTKGSEHANRPTPSLLTPFTPADKKKK